MTHRLWSRSIKKFLRREKARIRKTVYEPKEQARLINELYEKLGLKAIAGKGYYKFNA